MFEDDVCYQCEEQRSVRVRHPAGILSIISKKNVLLYLYPKELKLAIFILSSNPHKFST